MGIVGLGCPKYDVCCDTVDRVGEGAVIPVEAAERAIEFKDREVGAVEGGPGGGTLRPSAAAVSHIVGGWAADDPSRPRGWSTELIVWLVLVNRQGERDADSHSGPYLVIRYREELEMSQWVRFHRLLKHSKRGVSFRSNGGGST